jgi:hypothetical protein
MVPYAGDVWYLRRQKDAVGEYMWKVWRQGFRKNQPENTSRQGLYIATADGRHLVSSHHGRGAESVIEMIQRAVTMWKENTAQAAPEEAFSADRDFLREPPAGGLVLKTYSRIPLSKAELGGDPTRYNPNEAVGRDHMWVTKEEAQSLLPAKWERGTRYSVPPALAFRLIRFHLTDNVRGEPDMWTLADVREAKLELVVEDAGKLRLEGLAKMATAADARGYSARLQGSLTYDQAASRFTRFDVLSWGEAWGEGTFTRRPPPGRFPLLIAFTLAGNTPGDRIPPQAIRNANGYMNAAR